MTTVLSLALLVVTHNESSKFFVVMFGKTKKVFVAALFHQWR